MKGDRIITTQSGVEIGRQYIPPPSQFPESAFGPYKRHPRLRSAWRIVADLLLALVIGVALAAGLVYGWLDDRGDVPAPNVPASLSGN